MELSVNLIIVIVTAIISYVAFNNRNLFNQLKHYPYSEARNKEYYRWLTSGLIHGSFMHALVNLFVLYQFGRAVEIELIDHHGLVLGRVFYLLGYITMIVLADIPSYLKHKDNPRYASIGASGGVSGILLFACLLDPWNLLYLYLAIPLPCILFAIGYLWYSSWASKNQNDGTDHSAHFYGALAGISLYILLIPSGVATFFKLLIEDFPLF